MKKSLKCYWIIQKKVWINGNGLRQDDQYYKEVDTPWVNQIFNNIPIRIPVDILNKQVDSKVCI